MKETFNRSKAIKAQEKHTNKTGNTSLTPVDGKCYKCHRNIYDIISVEQAKKSIITKCPHCNYNYETIKLTGEDFDYDGVFIGNESILNHSGNLFIDGTGVSLFPFLNIKGDILSSESGSIYVSTSIQSEGNIYIKGNISANNSIEAKGIIVASACIKAGYRIKASDKIISNGSIKAGYGIISGDTIKADLGIVSGKGIQADCDIISGKGIQAGEYIKCKNKLSSKLRIFAGLCIWKLPKEEELLIQCGKLESGTIALGNLVETGLLKNTKQDKITFVGF